MTLPIPLSVRLSSARADRHIERDLRSLSFRSVAPGGFASAQFSLDRRLSLPPDEVAYYGTVDIYDARNGNIVWNGWLEDKGRSADDGQVYDLAAVGPSSHVQDRTVPYVLVDNTGDGWEKIALNPTERVDGEFDNQAASDGTGIDLRIRVPQGTTVNASAAIQVFSCRYRRLIDAGMKLARVTVVWDAGFDGTTEWNTDLAIRTGFTGTASVADINDVTTTGGTLVGQVVTDFANGVNVVEFRLRRDSGNTTVGDGNVWLVGTSTVRAMLVDKSGTELTSFLDYSALGDADIVADLLGRLLPLYDGDNATVSSAGLLGLFPYFAYPDGVTPGKVLDDVMAALPEKYWAAWEQQSNGLYRFEWVEWPTTVRYEADVIDGYRSQESAAGLFNRARVRFRGPSGAIQTVQVSAAVPQLDDAGRIRELFLDLGDNIARSAAAAGDYGENQLTQTNVPANAGTLTIARPIYDHDLGRTVWPWELRPGNLIRVQGLAATSSALNATGRDGVSVFRVISVEFDTGSASATLELDTPAQSLARTLSRIGARGEHVPSLPPPINLGRRR